MEKLFPSFIFDIIKSRFLIYIIFVMFSISLLLIIRVNEFGCFVPIFYILILTVVLFKKILFLREKINTIMCRAVFNQGTVPFNICSHRITKWLFSFILSIIFSSSIMIFFYLSDTTERLVIVIDAFFYYLVFNLLKVDSATSEAKEIVKLWVTILINCILLSVAFFVIKLEGKTYVIFDPALVEEVISTVTHNCIYFQHIARTAFYIDLNMLTFKSIPGHGAYIYAFIYLFSISFVPFIGISLIFNSCLLVAEKHLTRR